MESLDYYADVSGSDTNDDDDSIKCVSEESTYDREYIDDTEIVNNPSDYYGLTNVTRSVSDAEGDVSSQSDIDAFLDEGVEARNCCL